MSPLPHEFRSWLPSAIALTSFLCYTVLAGERLTVSKAFTSLSLFSYLQTSMVALPSQIFAVFEGAYWKQDSTGDPA
jgi:hypothetical protein